MKLLIADECSLTWEAKVGYFMYGGIIIDEAEAKPLAEGLLSIKSEYGIPKERPLKWTNKRWSGSILESEIHRSAKNDVLTLFANSAAKLIVCVSPHKFYHTPTLSGDSKVTMTIDPGTLLRSHQYGLSDLLAKFNRFVGEGDCGMVLVDRFGDAVKADMDQYCKDLFPNGTSRYPLPNITLPIIQVENEDSYLHQINDVVLGAIYGSFREMGHNFLPRIRNNFWAVDYGEGPKINGNGFTVYPQNPRYEWCQVANSIMHAKFKRLINQV